MAITYKWIISSLECYPEHEGKTDVVFNVHWRRQATDGKGHNADIYGCERVTLDPDAPFTPFASITEAQVIEWIESAFGPEKLAEQKSALNSIIADQIKPPVISPPLPWASA